MNLFDQNQVSKHLDHVRIVMVNTTLPANIGSALRAMKTMGLSKLVLVAPKTYPHPDIDALAAGAQQGQCQRGQQAESFTHNGSSVKNPIKFIIPQNFPLEHP